MQRWLLISFLFGCGARTSLGLPFVENDGSGANGGAPSTGGNGGNPSGPGGGGNMPCDALVRSEPVATMAADDDMHQRQPALAYASEARDQVTVAAEWFAVEGSAVPPSELRHATFAAWGDDWPSEIGPSYLADLDAGVSFAAAASTNGRLALLMSDGDKPQAPQGVLFSLDFGPESGIVPTKYTVSSEATFALFASLLREPAPLHLVGIGFPGVPIGASMHALEEHDNGIGIGTAFALGCADNAVSADAVATDEGWVVISSTAPGYQTGVCPGSASVGLSTTAYVAGVNTRGNPAMCTFVEHAMPAVVTRVAVAPHSGGAWAVWAFDDGRIEATRVDVAGCAVGATGFFPVTEPGDESVVMGAGSLGDELVVAYVRASDETMVVRVFDESGDARFTTSFQSGIIHPDPIEVIGSPAADKFVIAFSTAGPAGASRVAVARFECR